MSSKTLSVVQLLPELNAGGVERGTLEIANELVKHGHRSIVISGGGRLVDELVSSGSEHIPLDVGKKSLLSLRLISYLRRYFDEEKIDIIHARSRLPAWLTYLAWNKMDPASRPKFITSVHGAYRVNRYSEIMTKGQNVIATSNFIFKYITNNYPTVDKNKITLIHRGVSKTEFPFAFRPDEKWMKIWHEQHPFLTDKFILSLPARITRRKGHEDFLNILVKLRQQNIPVHGLIIGGAHSRKKNYLQELKEKSQALHLEDDITFLGHRNDVKKIMSISNIVLSLSNEPESFGRTALEALCLGIPVIAYDHGGATEILTETYPVGRVELNNTTAVCNKVISFYNDPVPVADKNPFTLDKMLNATLSLYSQSNNL